MIALDDLKTVLGEHYGVEAPAPQPLTPSWEGNVFHQPHPRSAGWVVRILDQLRAAGDARVLSYLEQMHYPAPKLIRTRGGRSIVLRGHQAVLVTEFIEGSPADSSLPTLRRLGQRLGQLHALDLTCSPELPKASMLPSTDMATALSWLRPLLRFTSPELADTHARLVAAIEGIVSGSDLPRTLIHNDAHPGNALATTDGVTVFIDWSGSGLGPPMVDLGFLLISSEIAISWATPLSPAEGRVEAIVDGYACYRVPTPAELEWLPHAMRFRGLLYGAAHIADTAARGLATVTETWWWERHLAAASLADRAREQFERHL